MKNVISLIRKAQNMRRAGPRRGLIAAIALAIFLLAGVATVSSGEEQLPDRFMLRMGGYRVKNADTIARLDANNLPVGTYVDFHDTLGGDTQTTVFRLDSLYRFNERHAIDFSWYDVKFSGSRVLSEDFTWNGVTYTIGTPVDSELKFDVYKLSYQYSLYHKEEVELGASFGLHIMKTFAGINASGISQAEDVSVTAPLPVFGLFADYYFTPRFSAFYNYQFFFVNYQDKVRGGLQDLLIGIEYRLFRHVALGTAYNRFALNVKAKGDNQTVYLDSSWNGWVLYGSLYF